MKNLGKKIANRRKDLGITQIEFADEMMVTRQTVSRWEAGTVLPDIDKISQIADILEVTCDYLLKDEIESNDKRPVISSHISRLLEEIKDKTVKFNFIDGEYDTDLFDVKCKILSFEGNWIKVQALNKSKTMEKLIPLSSILSIEVQEEE